MNPGAAFNTFTQTIYALRDPQNGCPWDLKQNHQTLIKFLIEETYEAVDAIDENDMEKIKDELGDILLQVVLHSVIAQQNNKFTIKDVIENINEKMIRRHPHVFSDTKVNSIDEVKKNWEQIKKEESTNQKNHYTFSENILSNTSLLSAHKIGDKTNKVDFDWNNENQVLQKVHEELRELDDELKVKHENIDRINEEFGDLLFTIVQLGRHLGINSEIALRKANKKFIERFNRMEDYCEEKGKNFTDLPRDEKEQIWKKIKGQI